MLYPFSVHVLFFHIFSHVHFLVSEMFDNTFPFFSMPRILLLLKSKGFLRHVRMQGKQHLFVCLSLSNVSKFDCHFMYLNVTGVLLFNINDVHLLNFIWSFILILHWILQSNQLQYRFRLVVTSKIFKL